MSASWDDLVEGTGPEPREYGPLTRTDFVRYQGASGDFNPIHHDEEFAVSAGYPTVFSVGILQAGILGTYCTEWLGAENVRQAMQWAQDGSADASIVALSLATVTQGGTSVPVDPALHDPLDQELVVCGKGGGSASARQFAQFVNSPDGRAIMRNYGFRLPGE